MSLLKIKVVPGSSRSRVDGWLGEALKIRVRAKPERGKANEAVVSLLAETLGIPKMDISISSGASSSRKYIEISNLTDFELLARLPPRDA